MTNVFRAPLGLWGRQPLLVQVAIVLVLSGLIAYTVVHTPEVNRGDAELGANGRWGITPVTRSVARVIEAGGAATDPRVLAQAASTPDTLFWIADDNPITAYAELLQRNDAGSIRPPVELFRSGVEFVYLRPGHEADPDLSVFQRLTEVRPDGRPGQARVISTTRLSDGRWLGALFVRNRRVGWINPRTRFLLIVFAASALPLLGTLLAFRLPLAQLARQAMDPQRGERPLEAAGTREFQRLADELNAMRERAAGVSRERMELAAGLGHDLNSPLTALRSRIEAGGPEDRAAALVLVDELAGMASDLLALAREDADAEPTGDDDVAAIAEVVVAEYGDRPVRFEAAGLDTIYAPVRSAALRRALRNLIDNALAHGSEAVVTATSRPDAVVVTVEDDGPGIPPDALEAVKGPFRRADNAQLDVRARPPESPDGAARRPGSAGLGLAIVERIAERHGGALNLANRPAGGLVAELTLPR